MLSPIPVTFFISSILLTLVCILFVDWSNLKIISWTGNNEIDSGCYKSHSSKVFFINFNPVASNVVCSSTLFGEIHIWDTVSFKRQLEYKFLLFVNPYKISINSSGISAFQK